jgi:aerobic carbon-monoxide dehydrogenase small subunit
MGEAEMKHKISFTVNGKSETVESHSMERLLDVLRENLKLTGTKEGCGEGECGACSIMMDGQLVNSCLVPVAQAAGKSILTIEGVGKSDDLHSIQKSFLHHGGAQCGICTPGMVMASLALLEKNPNPKREEVKEALAGNLCRCTGYMKIFDSVEKAGQP